MRCLSFRDHRRLKVDDDLVSIEAARISNEVKYITTIGIDDYEKMFPQLHNGNKKIIDHLKRKLLDKADEIKKLVKLQEVHKEQQEIKKLGDKFEEFSEEYMPHIRGFNSKLQDLLEQVEKDEKAKEDSKSQKK